MGCKMELAAVSAELEFLSTPSFRPPPAPLDFGDWPGAGGPPRPVLPRREGPGYLERGLLSQGVGDDGADAADAGAASRGYDDAYVWCVSAADGSSKWVATIDIWPQQTYARCIAIVSSPVVCMCVGYNV